VTQLLTSPENVITLTLIVKYKSFSFVAFLQMLVALKKTVVMNGN